MYSTGQRSKQIEQCIMNSHLSVAEFYKAKTSVKAGFERVGSGAAVFCGHDSFLSQVIAWGFDNEIAELKQQLAQIEAFYIRHDHKEVNIELSPFCGNAVAELLSEQNYQAIEFSNISCLELADAGQTLARQTKSDELQQWAEVSAMAFDCPTAVEQFKAYASAERVYPFHIELDGKIAACATIAIDGKVCDLGVTSTLPEFRGRGLQKQLIEARLAFAKLHQVEFATVTTEPGSISDLNIQKCGFKPAYTRLKYQKIIAEKDTIWLSN